MRKLILVIIAAIVLMPIATEASEACKPIPKGQTREFKSERRQYHKARTWVYGDSITYQTRNHLRKSLKGREAIDAVWGRDTRSAVDAMIKDVRSNRKHRPKVILMATGTNDLLNLTRFRKQVVKARNFTRRAGIKLVWVNVYVDANPDYRKANRILWNVKKVKVIKWSAVNKERRTLEGTSPLLYDGIHVNATGCKVRDNAIKEALR